MDVAQQVPVAAVRRGWFRRNWLWLIPAVFLSLCLACAGGGWVAALVVVNRVKSLEPYQMALKLVQEDPQVKAQLGEPIADATFFPSITMNVVNHEGSANLYFDVKGPKDGARVECMARLTGGKWGVTTLEVTPEKTGRRLSVDASGSSGNSDLDEAPRWKP
jgi:hypothetical protein